METENEEITIDLLDILKMLCRHWLLIVLCTAATASIGFAVLSYREKPAEPKYQASALFIVNTPYEETETGTGMSDQLNSAIRLANAYCIIIRSDTVLQKVIDDLDLSYTFKELKGFVGAWTENQTQVIRVTVTLPDAEEACRICDHIAQIVPGILEETAVGGEVKLISQELTDPDPAAASTVPKNTVIAALLGMMGCIGVLVLRYLLSSKIKNAEEAERYLGVRVLGVIPAYEEGKRSC